MIGSPKTMEEAKEYKYNRWAANPKGNSYKEGFCAYEVYATISWGFYQCSRKNGHGVSKLYCKQHAKILGHT